jgi:hypothetical protein
MRWLWLRKGYVLEILWNKRPRGKTIEGHVYPHQARQLWTLGHFQQDQKDDESNIRNFRPTENTILNFCYNLGMMAHACNTCTWETQTGLAYLVRPCIKTNKHTRKQPQISFIDAETWATNRIALKKKKNHIIHPVLYIAIYQVSAKVSRMRNRFHHAAQYLCP